MGLGSGIALQCKEWKAQRNSRSSRNLSYDSILVVPTKGEFLGVAEMHTAEILIATLPP